MQLGAARHRYWLHLSYSLIPRWVSPLHKHCILGSWAFENIAMIQFSYFAIPQRTKPTAQEPHIVQLGARKHCYLKRKRREIEVKPEVI